MEKKDLKIVFFGTPEFAVTSLDALVSDGFDVAAVVTMPDKPAGRGKKLQMSDVKRYAVEHDLRVLQPVKLRDPEFLEALSAIGADLFIVIAFRMLPEAVWAMPRLGTFNLHASLLPKYRGAAPINHAIINGEKETGITTFFLKHEIDTGDMIDQRTISIGEDENAGEIHDRLMTLGAEAVVDTVNAIIGGTLSTRPQPEGEFVAAWTRMTEENGRQSDIKIFSSSAKGIPADISLAPGYALVKGKHLYAGASDGPIEILSLQPAGKRPMPADAFILGYHPAKFE